MSYNHASQVKSYMGHLTDKEPDIFLVSEEGDQVGTHRIVLRLFSTVLSDIITQPEPVSHISVPTSGSVLRHLVNTLTTGVAITRDREELNMVAEVADSLGLDYIDWQIGLERKKKKREVEEIKQEDESLKGFLFESEIDERNPVQDVVKMEIIPDIMGEKVDSENSDQKKTINVAGGSNEERFGCDTCQKSFTVKKNLRKHKRLIHGISLKKDNVGNISCNERFGCDVCEKTFTTKKYRRRHVKDMHEVSLKNEIKKTCFECKKIHKHNPKDDKHYDCDQCNKKFYGLKAYQTHRSARCGFRLTPAKIVEPYVAEDPNHCHECKEAFKSQNDLIYHQDTKHVEGNPDFLSCRFCDRKIRRKQKGFFKEHLRKHTGESPEVCSYCGKSFKQKKALKNHERLHTGEKPYKCEFCFAAFTQRTSLVSHQKSKG